MIRITIARQAAFAAAFSIALGCGNYDSTGPGYPPPPPPPPSLEDGLWTASGVQPAILRLAPSQLLADGNLDPATLISTPSAKLFNLNGIAFDADGTMWVTSQDDSILVGFAPGSLTRSGSNAATVVIRSIAGSLSAPTSVAFDAQHRLWVANSANGTLVRFSHAQLSSSGAPVPEVTITGLGTTSGLAFDAAGSLWVSEAAGRKISSFTAAQLAVSGMPAPNVVLTSPATAPVSPAGIAFDAAGNLWVANPDGRTVVSFSPAQLSVTGAPLPHIVLSSDGGSLSIPVGLAFDGDGSLWALSANGAIEKFARASLAATAAPTPAVSLRITSHTLFWNLAFWPTPQALPLN